MALDNKPLDEITENTLQELISNKVAESKTIDYKQTLPGTSYKSGTDFLIDITAFANTAGGHLVYGMKENNGIPTEICGLDIKNQDAEILRLDNMIRDCITPCVPGIHIRAIPLQSSKSVIVVRIPKSFYPPHMVFFNKERKFYARSSAGNYPLDVPELRSLFLLSDTTAQRIRNFRMERLGKIASEETPVPLNTKAKVVLHIIPFGAFDLQKRYDLSPIDKKPSQLPPIYVLNHTRRYNFDGLLTYEKERGEPTAYSYVQLFHNGIIEAVNTQLLQPVRNAQNKKLINIDTCEEKLLKVLPQYFTVQKSLGVDTPLFIMLSLFSVLGCTIEVDHREREPIDRNDLIIPEIMLEKFDCDPAEVMRPLFDAIWNAIGCPCSPNYDKTGKRVITTANCTPIYRANMSL